MPLTSNAEPAALPIPKPVELRRIPSVEAMPNKIASSPRTASALFIAGVINALASPM